MSNYWTNTKTGKMVKNSFLIISKSNEVVHIISDKTYFIPGLEAMLWGPNVCQKLFFCGVKLLTDSYSSDYVTRADEGTLTSLIQTRWRDPLGQKLLPTTTTKKEQKKKSFQGSFHTHCLLKYTVWNIVGSQEIALDEHAKLRRGSVGGWIVLCA